MIEIKISKERFRNILIERMSWKSWRRKPQKQSLRNVAEILRRQTGRSLILPGI